MIYDTLDHAPAYTALHPLLAQAFAYLTNFDPATPEGQIKLRGDDLMVNIDRYTTRPAAEGRFESHEHYLDIQAVHRGAECLHWQQRSALEVTTPYDPESDVTFYEGPAGQRLTLTPGAFAMLWPQDAHQPGVQISGPEAVIKTVVKVRLDAP